MANGVICNLNVEQREFAGICNLHDVDKYSFCIISLRPTDPAVDWV